MKKVLIILVAVNLILMVFLGVLVYLSEVGPIRAASPLFGLQNMADQWRLRLIADPEKRAALVLDLVDRRLLDLAKADNPAAIRATARAFDRAVEQSLAFYQATRPAEQTALFNRFESLILQANVVLVSLESSGNMALLEGIRLKLAEIQLAKTPEELAALQPTKIQAVPVSFLDEDVKHEVFPLVGGHADLECTDCHFTGEYADTPAKCSVCHSFALDSITFKQATADRPMALDEFQFSIKLGYSHPDGDCAGCHTVYDWQASDFDHEGVTECSSCHLDDLPVSKASRPDDDVIVMNWWTSNAGLPAEADHYTGECGLCHQDGEDWKEISYQHDDVTECQSCHNMDEPAAHYQDSCQDCHADVEDWKVAVFNHAGYGNCYDCHTGDSPDNHYSGMCSSCHSTDTFSRAYFTHLPTYSDCRTCHTKPSQHYPGQCSGCHTSTAWPQTSFEHDGLGSCASCHAQPETHYPGKCTDCHTEEETWGQVAYSHASQNACLDCHTMPTTHYPGECLQCHTTHAWEEINFDHLGLTACLTCHSIPNVHYQGECQACHNTADWMDYIFNHSVVSQICLDCHLAPDAKHYFNECSVCHSTEQWYPLSYVHDIADSCLECHTAPSGHWPGECSSCHVLENWTEINFDHTTYTNCKACHARPTGHPRGQCSNCHATDTWLIPTSTPVEPTPTTQSITRITTPVPTPLPTQPLVTSSDNLPLPTVVVPYVPTPAPTPVAP